MRVGITGASGYVGAAMAVALVERGHEVVALVRRPAGPYSHRSYDLAAALDLSVLEGLEVVVHAAYDLTATAPDEVWRVNVVGTERLVEAARRTGTRVVLVSSMSAYEGTEQLYGRAKLACEATVLAADGDVVRLGLVYGGADGGMFGSLQRIAALPIVPLIGASSHQFLCHVDDMAQGFVALLESGGRGGRMAGLAYPEPVRFSDLIAQIAAAQASHPRVVPIPWQPVYRLMCALERAGVRLPLRAESVLGLVRPAVEVPNSDLWPLLGVELRPLQLDGPGPV